MSQQNIVSKSARDIFFTQLKKYIPNEDDCFTIEQSVYDYTLNQAKITGILENIHNHFFRNIYINKCKTLLLNMDSSSYVDNKYFLDAIINHSFDLKRIAVLSPQEIHPEHWKKYKDKQKATDDFVYSSSIGIRTTQFVCSKCKKNDCSYIQRQTRCNDEPTTTIVKCLNCHYTWSY
jgi:DNA-directed RNA polymerase subunit M/transcription elongation factor TFIIS